MSVALRRVFLRSLSVLAGLGLAVAGLGLAVGVFVTAGCLEYTLEYGYTAWLWLGLGLVVAGVLGLEFAWRRREEPNTKRPAPITIDTVVLAVLVMLLYANLLDFGVRWQAFSYAYLGFLAGACIVFARRRTSLTKGDVLYLKWGWVPIITIGVPLFIHVWKAKRLL